MQIHLDAVGGVAGDMFVAALLDAYPEFEPGLIASIAAATAKAPATCHVEPHNDGVLQGRRFIVRQAGLAHRHEAHDPSGGHVHQSLHGHHHDEADHAHDHSLGPHRHWADIRADLVAADLDLDVRDHAIAIFEHLARAEAAVHGIAVEAVAFHEVGAWDSIADIVAAAHLIAALGASRWTVGPLPLGSGRVNTAHGWLPVPAPATALLLKGFSTIDDGIGGERITPTGAAILRHLCANTAKASGSRVLGRTGIGFGTKTMPGLSNCLRVLVFEESDQPMADHRELGIVEFEVDDQSAEDLAMGLDRLRDHADIFDVVQMPVFGKKGRMMVHVRALARATAIDAAVAACFRETTTIGLRHHIVAGASLARAITTVDVGGRMVRVKTVDRPGGRTAKAEADDALGHETHAARIGLRREAERLALLDRAEGDKS